MSSEAKFTGVKIPMRRLGRYEQPLGIDSDDHEIWYRRGEALANLKRNEEALVCFDKAIKLAPKNQAAWTFRGVVLIHLKRYEEALTSCDKALDIAPEDKEAWMFRGAALHGLGRYKQAYASYDKALGIKKTSLWQRLIEKVGNW